MIKLILILFSANCDSIQSQVYVKFQQIKDVKFCQCVSRNEFDNDMKSVKSLFKFSEDCPEAKLDSLEKVLKTIRKDLK